MAKQEFLNFKEISSKIAFKDVLDWLNISYQQKDKELRGEGFIVNVEKNLFFVPDDDSIKGGIINFVSHFKKTELRQAATLLKAQFLSKIEAKPKRVLPNLTLEYDEYLNKRSITPEVAKEYSVGLCREKSIMSGRICIKCHDAENNHISYIGYREKDDSWFSPKGFKRPLYNAHRISNQKSVIVTVDPFDALRIFSMGITQVVSLLANSMTAEQEEHLKKFKYILLLHREPANIVNRLYENSFIKAPVLSKPLKDLSDTELLYLIKPS